MLQRMTQVFFELCLQFNALAHGFEMLIDREVHMLVCMCGTSLE
jgi:hypothetical protein